MKQSEIILIGGGGHCKSCIDVIEMQGRYIIVGIVDLISNKGNTILGYPIIACDDELDELSGKYSNFFITLGQIRDFTRRLQIFQILIRLKVSIPSIISPLAYVSRHSQIGIGTIIMHQAIVNAGATIGQNCIINTKSLIEHDAVIGDHCHISTGSIVNGGVNVGNFSFYGSGAVSKEFVTLPEKSFIKANSIVK